MAKGKQGWMALVRLGIGLLVLLFVVRTVPWVDQLHWTDAAGVATTVEGEIEGDWKAETVVFRLGDEASVPDALPETFQAALSAGEPITVARAAPVLEGEVTLGSFAWDPGMPTAFSGMDRGLLLQATLMLLASFLVVVTRWWRLLAISGCPTSWFNALRLTFIGMFFNLVVPGLTGGDVIKAVVVASENPQRRTAAMVSVIVDRILGMGSLALIAGVVILASGSAFAELRLGIFGLLLAGLVGTLIYANPGLRKKISDSKLIDRLPLASKLRKIDDAAMVYLRHPIELTVAVLLSLANHAVIILAVFFLGLAIGVDREVVTLVDYFVIVPVANIVSSIPLAPGGWGVGEYIYGSLFEIVGAAATLGVAVSIVFRLIQLGFGLVGGLFLLLPGAREAVRQAEADVQTGS